MALLRGASASLLSWKSTGKVQQTLASAVEKSGITLHSGSNSVVKLLPAFAGQGRFFVCGDTKIPAFIDYVTDTVLCTTLSRNGVRVRMVEHLLFALESTGVDNCQIHITRGADEVPLLDGSAKEWVEAIEQVGFCAAKDPNGNSMEKLAPFLHEPVHVWRNDSFITTVPSPKVQITCGIDFPQCRNGPRMQICVETLIRLETDILKCINIVQAAKRDVQALRANLSLKEFIDDGIVVGEDVLGGVQIDEIIDDGIVLDEGVHGGLQLEELSDEKIMDESGVDSTKTNVHFDIKNKMSVEVKYEENTAYSEIPVIDFEMDNNMNSLAGDRYGALLLEDVSLKQVRWLEMAVVTRDCSTRVQGLFLENRQKLLLSIVDALTANEHLIEAEYESDVAGKQSTHLEFGGKRPEPKPPDYAGPNAKKVAVSEVPAIGSQWFSSVAMDDFSFVKDIASSRTFCVHEEVEQMYNAGFIKGGSTENAIVCSIDKGWLNPPLRFQDEPCRHKVLDLVGDLSLLARNGHQGLPLAHIIAYKGGHSLHAKFVRHLSGPLKNQSLQNTPDLAAHHVEPPVAKLRS